MDSIDPAAEHSASTAKMGNDSTIACPRAVARVRPAGSIVSIGTTFGRISGLRSVLAGSTDVEAAGQAGADRLNRYRRHIPPRILFNLCQAPKLCPRVWAFVC